MMQLVNLLFEIVSGFLASIIEGTFDLIDAAIPARRNTQYDADFISSKEILSPGEKGFAVGKLNFPVSLSYKNFFVAGQTGVGKSANIFFNSLFTMDGNYLVHDTTSEIYETCSGYLYSQGYDIKVINFTTPIDCFNPIARANNSSAIAKIASMIVNATLPKTNDNFWNLQSISLLTLLIGILKTQSPEYQNLANVQRLLNLFAAKPSALDLLFIRCGNKYLLDEWKSFNGYEAKVLSNIIATCKASLSFLNDDTMRRLTSHDTIEVESFRTKKCVVFFQNSIAHQKYLSVLTSILFEQYFESLLNALPTESDRDVFILLDECASLRLPTLAIAVTTMRKFRVGTLISVQSVAQLFENYSRHDAETIRGNCFSQLYFTGADLQTSQELEAILGRFEFEDEKGQRRVMPLMSSDAIRTMDDSRALLICGNRKPAVVKLRPHYKSNRMMRLSKLPQPTLKCKIPFDEVPMLPLIET